MSELSPIEREAVELLKWLIDMEGPQPGNSEWASKVQQFLSKIEGN